MILDIDTRIQALLILTRSVMPSPHPLPIKLKRTIVIEDAAHRTRLYAQCGHGLCTLNAKEFAGHPPHTIILSTMFARPLRERTADGKDQLEVEYEWTEPSRLIGGIPFEKIFPAFDHSLLPGLEGGV